MLVVVPSAELGFLALPHYSNNVKQLHWQEVTPKGSDH